MIEYRWHSAGVVRFGDGRVTVIGSDPDHPEWCEFEYWRSLGNEPLPSDGDRHLYGAGVTEAEPESSLYIIGAGGYGREIATVLKGLPECGREWKIAGFLNDIEVPPEEMVGMPPILGTTDYWPQPTDLFICAIGDPQGRREVCEKFRAKGARFLNHIAPDAVLHSTARLGEGMLLETYTAVGANTEVGSFTSILVFSSIGHDCVIGEYVQIAPSVSILGRVRIGSGTMVGAGAIILPGVTIGENATIGAGSVVINDVPDGAKVFGVPARRLS